MDYVSPHFIVYNAAELWDDWTVVVAVANYHTVTIRQTGFCDVESVFGGYIGDSEGAEVKENLDFGLGA